MATTTAADTTRSDQEVWDLLHDLFYRHIDLHGKLLYVVLRTETVASTLMEFDWRCVFGETLTRVAKTEWSQHQIREAAFVLVRDVLPLEHNPEREDSLTWERVFEGINA